MWSRAQGCLRGQLRLDAVQFCPRVAGVPTHLTAQKSFYVVISRAGDQVDVFIDDAVELRTQLTLPTRNASPSTSTALIVSPPGSESRLARVLPERSPYILEGPSAASGQVPQGSNRTKRAVRRASTSSHHPVVVGGCE